METRPSAVPAAAPGAADPTGHLIRQLESGADETALGQALARLATAADARLVLATVKGLVQAGVAGLAVRLLRSFGGDGALPPEFAELAAHLETLPSGHVPWSDFDEPAQRNLDTLLEWQPELRPFAAHLRAAPANLSVFRSRLGNLHVARDGPEGRLGLVFPFHDQHAAADAAALGECDAGAAFLLLGVPVPPVWERLRGLRHESRYRPAVDLVEPDLDVLAAWLRLVDLGDAVRDGQLHLSAGPKAVQHYRSFVETQLARPLPKRVLHQARPGWAPPPLNATFFQEVEVTRERGRLERLAIQAGYYDERDDAWWARRFDDAVRHRTPLRIIGFTTRFSTYIQFVMRDLAAAFARRGCELEIVMEPHDSACIVDTWSALAARPYDLAIAINHLRFELENRLHPRLPYVAWIQDHMPVLFNEGAGRTVGPFDLVLGRNAAEMCGRFGYPEERFLVTSNLTDLETYCDEPLPACDLEPYRCDVSYVGHGSESAAELIEMMTAGSPPYAAAVLHRFADLAATELDRGGLLTYVERLALLRAAEAESGASGISPEVRGSALWPSAARVVDRLIRHRALAGVARWAERRGRSLRLFGRGWDRSSAWRRHACGEVSNGKELRAVAQASSINLQLNGYSALHQRLLDAVAAGGFVLARYAPRDFLNVAAAPVTAALRRGEITTWAELVRRREEDAVIDGALAEMERLGMPAVRRADSEQRRHEDEMLRAAGREDVDEASLFARLRRRCLLPDRQAGDIPGFAALVFRTDDEAAALLDRYVDDAPARRGAIAPVREWVVCHATYDGLVERVLERFRDLFRKESARHEC